MSYFKFAHIGLSCKDLDVTVKFYMENFGFKQVRVVSFGDDRVVFLETENGDLKLELFSSKDTPPAPPVMEMGPNYPGFRHIAFLVDDVEAALAKLGNNVRITQKMLDFSDIQPGWKAAWVADPDDRVIEITQADINKK